MSTSVSFILLSYNQEQVIEDAVKSALEQEGPAIEIVISDDASTDRTYFVIQDCVAKYKGPHRVIVNRNKENLGITGNFQKAFKLSSGLWIVAAGGDDISEKSRVNRISKVICEESCVMAVSSYYSIQNSEGIPMPVSYEWFLNMAKMQEWTLEKILNRGCWGRPIISLLGAATAWHRDLFEKFPPLSDAPGASEDSVLRWRALILGHVRFIPDQLVVYRRLVGSTTNVGAGASKNVVTNHRRRMLNRALSGYIQAKADFAWAAENGLFPKDRALKCISMLDYIAGYQRAQLEFRDASFFKKIKYFARYWRAGLWRLIFKKTLYA